MKKIGLFAVLMLGLLGQAQAGGWNNDAVVGGALGGAAGAAVGSAIGGRDAAIIGGVLGGALGVAVATQPRHQVVVQRGYAPMHAAYVQPGPRGHAYGYRAHAPYGHVPPPHGYGHAHYRY